MPTVADPIPKKLLTLHEAAAGVLAVSDRTLWALTAPRGPIRPVRIGRAVRYSREALAAFIASQEMAES